MTLLYKLFGLLFGILGGVLASTFVVDAFVLNSRRRGGMVPDRQDMTRLTHL